MCDGMDNGPPQRRVPRGEARVVSIVAHEPAGIVQKAYVGGPGLWLVRMHAAVTGAFWRYKALQIPSRFCYNYIAHKFNVIS